MSNDLNEAMKLLRDMASIMDPEHDYLAIVATEEQTALAESKRKRELEQAYTNLKSLSRVLDAARASSTRPATVPSAEEHASLLNEQDVNRFQLAKAINDAEGLLASKEAELTALKEEARVLEESDPALEHERELNGTALRMRMYKGIGFEPMPDKDGKEAKMLVRTQAGDVHKVDLSNGQSEFDNANMLWKMVSSH